MKGEYNMWLVIGLSIGINIGAIIQMIIDDKLEERRHKYGL